MTEIDTETIHDLIRQIKTVIRNPPVPEKMYEDWENGAREARNMIPECGKGTHFEIGLKVHGSHDDSHALSSPALANVSDCPKLGEARVPQVDEVKVLHALHNQGSQARLSTTTKWKKGVPVLQVMTRQYCDVPTTHGVSVFGSPFYVTKDELKELYQKWYSETSSSWSIDHDIYLFYPILFKRRFATPFVVTGETINAQKFTTNITLERELSESKRMRKRIK